MATYNTDMTEDELVSYLAEVSTEEVILPEDVPDASFPELKEATDNFYNTDGMIDSGVTSLIPLKIDKLNIFHHNVLPQVEVIGPILQLKNSLMTDVIVTDNYNGICVELNTLGHNLIIDSGSTVVAL